MSVEWQGRLTSEWTLVGGLRLHARVSPFAQASAQVLPARLPVVLLPGLNVSSRHVAPTAVALAPYAPAAALDLPGFGVSDTPAYPLRLPELADVAAEWMRTTRRAPALLLGSSFGTQIAAALAARHPELVAGLVLASPTLAPGERWLPLLYARWRRNARFEPPAVARLSKRDYRDVSTPQKLFALREMLRPANRLEARLPALRMPVLIVRGGRDPLVPAAWARELAQMPPQARLVTIPGRAHSLEINAADELARVVRAFACEYIQGKEPHQQ